MSGQILKQPLCFLGFPLSVLINTFLYTFPEGFIDIFVDSPPPTERVNYDEDVCNKTVENHSPRGKQIGEIISPGALHQHYIYYIALCYRLLRCPTSRTETKISRSLIKLNCNMWRLLSDSTVSNKCGTGDPTTRQLAVIRPGIKPTGIYIDSKVCCTHDWAWTELQGQSKLPFHVWGQDSPVQCVSQEVPSCEWVIP